MADENTPAAPPAQGTQDLGGAMRVTPSGPGEKNPTLEEQSQAQDQASETAEQKAEREAAEAKERENETPEQKAEREAAEAAGKEKEAPGDIDLTGTVFEGLSPEMQGKIKPFAAAFAANGTLTDAEITEAAHATGFSEAMVKQFMAGAQNTAAENTKPVIDQFGGEDQFKEFQAWTREGENLTPAEDRSINKAINEGDYETAAQLMKAPMDRWRAAGGGKPARDVTKEGAGGGGDGGEAGDTYANWAQVEKDMNDPKYRTDAAYRANVEAKIARSQL